MAQEKDTLVAWLRDAHAMEKGTVDNLERLAGTLEKDYPQLAARFRTHREESRAQAERLVGCLQRLGTDSSTLKDATMRVEGVMQAYASKLTSDEVVKNCLAAYAYEHFEIASYLSLAAAARELGDPEIAQVCEGHLQQERAMASWLEQQIPTITQEYLTHEGAVHVTHGAAERRPAGPPPPG